jgi:hypothetical protein
LFTSIAGVSTKEGVWQTITSYWCDANGNLARKDDGTNVSGYTYDVRNLMTDYDGPGSNNDATYRYDSHAPGGGR